MAMIKKIFQFLKSCFSFWKNFATSKNKKEFLSEKAGELKTQIIILLLSAFSVFVVYNSLKPAVRGVCRIILQSEEDENDGMDDRVAGIEAEKVKAGTTLRQIKSIGILKGNAEVVIKSEIPGKIQGIQFTEGSHVEKNQELIVFEDDLYKANKARAEAECELAKGDFERQKKLFQGKAGSQKIYEEALAKMNSAKAELDKAAYELSRTRIKAPFSGTVGIMKISAGNIVEQHRDLVNLVDNSLVKVEFWIPAKYIE
ncbi:MAG: efflux RND transporter periplasmic adaptor subunit, partial [Clostridia bacterium]|nr:efflux RND transporter periplasmic adaptor subunit [Clostridia bacterium]